VLILVIQILDSVYEFLRFLSGIWFYLQFIAIYRYQSERQKSMCFDHFNFLYL